MKSVIILFFATVIALGAKTKIACVGDSITFGSSIPDRARLSYPAQLGSMLGAEYEVINYGIGARTMLSKGDHPYTKEKIYRDSLAFAPDIVIIKLGTNDSKPHNWKHKADFINDTNRLRLDKYISHQLQCGSKSARLLIAQGKVCLDSSVVRDNLMEVSALCNVTCNGNALNSEEPQYIMLNKPRGCVSATVDDGHQTVVDLIAEPYAEQLHIAGRLDKESTGLLILTNDGTWSKLLTEPVMAIPKRYLVTTKMEMEADVATRFAEGFYFAYEDITTLPAELEILSEKSAIVTIYEGKYHQIKRMFHAVGNRITSLHRLSVGCLELDPSLDPGSYRSLTDGEITATKNLCSQ